METLNLTEDREKIRSDLSHMSFEQLQKLKETVGAKVYNETLFGERFNKKRKVHKITEHHQPNKTEPLEMSSKQQPVIRNNRVQNKKANECRDPRFDQLCGKFNHYSFKRSYQFVDELKRKERKALLDELNNVDNPEEEEKIKYLLQRMDNQLREKERNERNKKQINEKRKQICDKLMKGQKPVFEKKSEKKISQLLQTYDDLKSNNKLNKHIEKKSKKMKRKEPFQQ